jgi:hypothetical protein
VLLPPSFDSVSIEAIDKGKDHGQWIALSAPYQCR